MSVGSGPTEAEMTNLALKMATDLNLCSELEENDGGWASYLLRISLLLLGVFSSVSHTHTHV